MGWRGLGFWVLSIVFGLFMIWVGVSSDSEFPVGLGVSLAVAGIAVLVTHFGAPARPSYTTMGLSLLLFWGFAAGNRLDFIFGELDGNIEMFFLSGVAMVSASTFVLIYNADVFLAFVERVGGTFGSILPSLRTAIAYPMANRFRTGMTLSMISLVVFAITTMSTMNLNYDKLFLRDESRGGWDVQVIENPNNPFLSLKAALTSAGHNDVAGEISAEGAVYIAGFDSATEVSADGEEFVDYFVRGVSDGFTDNGSVPLDMKATGYETDTEIWQALKTQDDVAVIDRFTVEQGFGPAEFTLEGVDISTTVFEPVPIIVRDSGTGASREVKIIGIISFGASGNFTGVYLGEGAFLDTFGEPELAVHYAAVADPGAAEDIADNIEAALVTTGAQAKSLQEIANENTALSRNFLYLMQAFMGLGLVVGIAAIGVIAFRTVVERRQQIGMLRAIGYKRSQVALSFMLESGFVTFLGVISGAGLGIWLAYFLVTGDDFPGGGGNFYVPWVQIGIMAFLTISASFLMTWIPARQAASVPTAEALRYE
jgi:putative ABC transport system permease protein